MPEIEIKRGEETIMLIVVDSLKDAQIMLRLLNTREQRQRVLAEVKAFFDKQAIE